ncbi:hypothetical protein X474_13685 [Dethiosulfatarculus sandiegensis]|uniref:Uncharacterized protein n=1 Tax=Dethiosulfatarculus sandiegensis TaxID=1429043 RepID=A0A0D2GF61_9BACT|nr:hypothetical protein X474_13685 [Dethiosulfatarculus sandiegensis]
MSDLNGLSDAPISASREKPRMAFFGKSGKRAREGLFEKQLSR